MSLFEELKLMPGKNLVRILTPPYQCLRGCEDRSIATHWIIGLYSYNLGKFLTLKLGFKTFKALAALAKDNEWGDPTTYDINMYVEYNVVGCFAIPSIKSEFAISFPEGITLDLMKSYLLEIQNHSKNVIESTAGLKI